jgi:hypothetical protein
MIETRVFEDLNVFGPDNTRTIDLDENYVPEPEPKGCIPFLKSKFRNKNKNNRPTTFAPATGVIPSTSGAAAVPSKAAATAKIPGLAQDETTTKVQNNQTEL